jgi:hypothetical protein
MTHDHAKSALGVKEQCEASWRGSCFEEYKAWRESTPPRTDNSKPGFSNDFTPKIPRSWFVTGFSNDFTPKIPRSWLIHRRISDRLHSENPAVSESLRDFSINFTPKIPRSTIHLGIFERLHSKDPAVFESSRDFRMTSLRKSRSLESSRDFWMTSLWKSRGLQVVAGFWNDFNPIIPRSSSHCGIFDRLHSKNPGHHGIFDRLHSKNPAVFELSRDTIQSTSLWKSRGLRVIAGFLENWTTKNTLSWSYVPSHSQGN